MIDLTESSVLTGLRAFILDVVPAVGAANVVRGQQNRVPMPVGPNFIVMTPVGRGQLATAARAYRPDDDARDTKRSTRVNVQLDIYGPAAAENCQIIATLLRDMYGCDFLRPHHCQPLFCGDPTQLPLVAGEKQYEQRWTLAVTLQFNPTVSTTQQFADIVDITIVEADQYGN